MSKANGHSYSLFGAMLRAPLTGVAPRGKPKMLHAVTMEALSDPFVKPMNTVQSACGLRVKVLAKDGGVALWPPRVRGIKGAIPRCAECYEKTGRPRLRVPIVPADGGNGK